ncbi:hypothetical protein [Megalodesulfovibrio gigas]|nr:hypothetical protein [Megalodesulfovibrio gigas]
MEMPPVLTLRDAKHDAYGTVIRQDIWERIMRDVLPMIDALTTPAAEEAPEPMADWEALLQYWDFAYPPDRVVVCDHCGARSEDWLTDEPRKFTLKAAAFSGLVNFECQQCQARVLKRHFKDKYKFECKPFTVRRSST